MYIVQHLNRKSIRKPSLNIQETCKASMGNWTHENMKNKYIDWFNANLANDFRFLTAEACYQLRCGVVHMGRYNRGSGTDVYERVIFTLPKNGNVFHENLMGRADVQALNLDPDLFCGAVIRACKRWYDKNRGNPVVQRNEANVLHVHALGVAPYMFGMPVIAWKIKGLG